jgi:hypothetical protein
MPRKLNAILGVLTYALIVMGLGYCAELNTEIKSFPSKHVMEMSMDERVGASSLNTPLKEDSIVFPHTNAVKILPNPVIVSAGSLPVSSPDVDRVVWTVCPKDDRYVEYLAKRETFLKAGEDLKLIKWCEEHDLPLAAEFELRRVLSQIKDIRNPEYQRYLTMWLKYADKRQTEYSFSLPVDGEWFVLRDKTGHHRTRHFAAYAFDLVIMEGGKRYRGSGRRLEDYYCWGKPILAQADGIVIRAVDGNPDGMVGERGPFDRANSVTVYYGGGVCGVYVHLQQSSLKVKVGQKVSEGDVLALIGNSGASGEPHLHFTMADMSSFSVRGVYSFQLKRGLNWIDVSGQNLVAETYIRYWNPHLEGKQAQPDTPADAGATFPEKPK